MFTDQGTFDLVEGPTVGGLLDGGLVDWILVDRVPACACYLLGPFRGGVGSYLESFNLSDLIFSLSAFVYFL